MPEPTQAGPARRARILQISDLHVGSWGWPPVLDQLERIVHQEKPDLLIVSGDQVNHPFPWAMRRAARFIERLRTQSGKDPLPILTLAGNHDYKLWGNFGMRRLTRVPFYVYFRENGLDLSWLKRWCRYVRLSVSAFWPCSQALQDPLAVYKDEKLGLLLVGFNSNALAEMLAAGKVDAHSLQEFSDKLATWENDPAFAAAYKIAVVHHHPAPIPFVRTDRVARIQESFMVLYNAGTLLRLLYDAGFQLVLHGHKHFAGFSRISYAVRPGEQLELAIAAAGSAGHPSPDDPRGNHLHVIDLFDDDTATLVSRFFNAEVVLTDASRCYVLLDLGSVRKWRRQRQRISTSLTVNKSVKTVEITTNGYSETEIIHYGCRVVEGMKKTCHPCRIRMPEPTYVRNVKEASTGGTTGYLSIKKDSKTLRTFDGRFDFHRAYNSSDSPFDFGVSFRLMNGHTLTRREFLHHYAGTGEEFEYSSIQCDFACEALANEVIFPQGYDVSRLEAAVEVLYLPAPVTELDVFSDEIRPRSHAQEAQRIRDRLRKKDNKIILEVPDPVPGFIYRIRWKLEHDEAVVQDVPWQVKANARAGRQHLIDLGNRVVAKDKRAVATYQKILQALDNIAIFVKQHDVLLQPKSSETLDLSLMVFDDATKRLRFVALSFAELETLFEGGFVSGEGCAGWAFEKTRVVPYHPGTDDAHYFIDPEEWATGELIEQECMISVPWVYPGGEGPNTTVGVLNIGSRKPDSELIAFLDLGEDEQAAKGETLMALTTKAGSGIFDLVKAGSYAEP